MGVNPCFLCGCVCICFGVRMQAGDSYVMTALGDSSVPISSMEAVTIQVRSPPECVYMCVHEPA